MEDSKNKVTRCFWTNAVKNPNYKERLVMVMRSAERVDRVFGDNWKQMQAPNGKIRRNDLNVPKSLDNLLKTDILDHNSPITATGKYASKLVGRCLFNRGIAPSVIVCAPELRCIETAAAIAGFEPDVKIQVEPGLAHHLSPVKNYGLEQLSSMYPIDKAYKPLVPLSSLEHETNEQSADRLVFVLKNLAAKQRTGPLLIIGHAQTLHAAVLLADSAIAAVSDEKSNATSFSNCEHHQELAGMFPNMLDLGLRYPPGCTVSIARRGEAPPHSYKLVPNLIPPFTYGETFCNSPITIL